MALLRRSPVYLVLAVYGVVIAYPLLWMLGSSFKSSKEIYADPWGLPSVWLVQNYAEAWDKGISAYFVNSLFSSDPYPVMAWLMVVATMVILFNLIADILYGVLDPRIRHA